MPENEKCSNCLFWLEIFPPDDKKGACHHFPPAGPLEIGISNFPTTDTTDYCGEFQFDPDGVPNS